MHTRQPALQTLLLDTTPPQLRATVIGLYFFLSMEGRSLVQPVAGYFMDKYINNVHPTTNMKAIFAHDHRFILSGGEVFSESQFPATFWKRYLDHFDHLTVACREGKKPPGKLLMNLEHSSAPGVNFTFFPNLSSVYGQLFHRKDVLRQMIGLVSHSDAVIARLPSERIHATRSPATTQRCPALLTGSRSGPAIALRFFSRRGAKP